MFWQWGYCVFRVKNRKSLGLSWWVFKFGNSDFLFPLFVFHILVYTYLNMRILACVHACMCVLFDFNSRRSEGLLYTYIYLCTCSTHGPRHIFKWAADIARKKNIGNKTKNRRAQRKVFSLLLFRPNDKPLRHVNPTTHWTAACLIRSAKVGSPAVHARISPLHPGHISVQFRCLTLQLASNHSKETSKNPVTGSWRIYILLSCVPS